MRALAVSLASVVALGGCALTVDGAYLLGDGTSSRSTDDAAPIAQTVDRLEYEAAVEPDGAMRVACFARTRQLERSVRTTRTYRYQGGFPNSTYAGTAILDVLFGGLVAGTILGICTRDDSDASCWNMLWAAPYAVDLGYALIRYRTVEPPVLIDKSSTTGGLGFAPEPVQEQQTACESLASVWLGTATGPDDLQILTGHADDASERALSPDAVELALGPSGDFALSTDAAERWARSAQHSLWAVDRDGTPHVVAVDRCAALRPVQGSLSVEAQTAYREACVPQTQQP